MNKARKKYYINSNLIKLKLIFIILASIKGILCGQVIFLENIPIEKNALLLTGSFVVLENGYYIFADIKDKDNQFKIFDPKGRLVKAWGKMGPGPEEFGGIGLIDYKNPYLLALDAGKHSFYIFETSSGQIFKKLYQIPCWEAKPPIKIYNNEIISGTYIIEKNGNAYALMAKSFEGTKTEYFLKIENIYGTKSKSEYRSIRDRVSGFTSMAFMDIFKDVVFYVSDVRPAIVKINLKSKETAFLNKPPKNFRPLEMDKQTRNLLLSPETGKKIAQNLLATYSFVKGIFVDEDFIGLLYSKAEKKENYELVYHAYLQLYNHSDQPLNHQRIEHFYSEDAFLPFFYEKNNNTLYLLSLKIEESGLKYEIYKYSIKR